MVNGEQTQEQQALTAVRGRISRSGRIIDPGRFENLAVNRAIEGRGLSGDAQSRIRSEARSLIRSRVIGGTSTAAIGLLPGSAQSRSQALQEFSQRSGLPPERITREIQEFQQVSAESQRADTGGVARRVSVPSRLAGSVQPGAIPSFVRQPTPQIRTAEARTRTLAAPGIEAPSLVATREPVRPTVIPPGRFRTTGGIIPSSIAPLGFGFTQQDREALAGLSRTQQREQGLLPQQLLQRTTREVARTGLGALPSRQLALSREIQAIQRAEQAQLVEPLIQDY